MPDTAPLKNRQNPAARAAAPRRKSAGKTGGFSLAAALWGFCFLFFFCAFSALGIWQIERLAWKENLIRSANAHTKMPLIPAPPKADWGQFSARGGGGEAYNYRPVWARGIFLNDKEILVKASVLLNPLDETGGAGYWLMTPLQQQDGSYIFINRGFLPLGREARQSRLQSLPEGETRVSGLLRLSEGAGHLFNKNDPRRHIWYNRQLPALAASAGLPAARVAPYFIDADKTPNPGGVPLGGLTVVQFPNNHLVYAITWFCGALGTIAAAVLVFRSRRKQQEEASP